MYHPSPSLLTLPPELRDAIWALLVPSGDENDDNSGILNCCKQTAREMTRHIIQRNTNGDLPGITIRVTADCLADRWLTFEFWKPPLDHLGRLLKFPDDARWWHIGSMDNPIIDDLHEASSIDQVHVVFDVSEFQLDVDLISNRSKRRHWLEAPFLCHFAKAMDVSHMISSLKGVGKTVIHTNLEEYDLAAPNMYWHSTPYHPAHKRQGFITDLPLSVLQLILRAFHVMEQFSPLRGDGILTFWFTGESPVEKRLDIPFADSWSHFDWERLLGPYENHPVDCKMRCPNATLCHSKLLEDYVMLLDEVGMGHVEALGLRQHQRATRKMSDRNFFRRLAKSEPQSPPSM